MSDVLPICPTDCSGVLPEMSFNDCSPVVARGRVRRLYLGKPTDSAFADWTDDTEWLIRIDNAASTADVIRALTVIGTKPQPEYTDLEISDDRRVIGEKTHKIDFKIDEVTDENYDFLRAMECGVQVKAWYATKDFLYGGNDGINCSIKLDEVIPEGSKELTILQGTITWTSKHSPPRTPNPLT